MKQWYSVLFETDGFSAKHRDKLLLVSSSPPVRRGRLRASIESSSEVFVDEQLLQSLYEELEFSPHVVIVPIDWIRVG